MRRTPVSTHLSISTLIGWALTAFALTAFPPRTAHAAAAEVAAPADAPLIVLIPGFLNSFTNSTALHRLWPYFAKPVVESVASRGSPVVVVDTLLPIANISDNGDLLVHYLDSAAREFPGRKMVLIAHSAGGLYLLHALTKRPDLPVQTVVTIGTPYNGVEFVDRLNEAHPELQSILPYLDLNSVKQFEAKIIQSMLQTFVVPQGIRWVTIAGSLPACKWLNCTSADHLSWVLSLTQHLMTEPSDGVVTVSSALGNGTRLTDSNGQPFDFERWDDFNFDLEHWEMVEDARNFVLLGILNPGRISSEQRKLFTALLDRLFPEVKGPQVHPNTPIVRAPPAPQAP